MSCEKRIISILLAVVLVGQLFVGPIAALAEEARGGQSVIYPTMVDMEADAISIGVAAYDAAKVLDCNRSSAPIQPRCASTLLVITQLKPLAAGPPPFFSL